MNLNETVDLDSDDLEEAITEHLKKMGMIKEYDYVEMLDNDDTLCCRVIRAAPGKQGKDKKYGKEVKCEH